MCQKNLFYFLFYYFYFIYFIFYFTILFYFTLLDRGMNEIASAPWSSSRKMIQMK